MTIQQQALEMAEYLLSIEGSNNTLDGGVDVLAYYLETEMRGVFRAGQAAALERKGIQPRLDIEQEVSTR